MKPGTRIRLASPSTKTSHTTVVIKTAAMEVVHLIIPRGQSIPAYEAQGEITLHCLSGSVSVSALGSTYELGGGEIVYLLTNERFSLQAKEDSSVLVTMIARRGTAHDMIGH